VGFLTFWVENQQLRMAVTIRINPPLTEPLSQEGLWQYSQGTQLHELIHAADWETRIREKIKELKLSGEPINLSEIVNEVALEQRITDETRAFWAQMWYLAGETNWFEPTPEDDLPYVYGRGPQLNGLKYPFLYLKNLGVDLFQEREAIAAAANESDLEYLWWFLVDIKVFANEENQAFFQEQYLESPQFRVYIDECRRLDFISQAEYQWLFEGDSLRVAVSKETLEENPALCGGAIILAPAVVLLALLSLSRRSK
jgi:hypothetical protein